MGKKRGRKNKTAYIVNMYGTVLTCGNSPDVVYFPKALELPGDIILVADVTTYTPEQVDIWIVHIHHAMTWLYAHDVTILAIVVLLSGQYTYNPKIKKVLRGIRWKGKTTIRKVVLYTPEELAQSGYPKVQWYSTYKEYTAQNNISWYTPKPPLRFVDYVKSKKVRMEI